MVLCIVLCYLLVCWFVCFNRALYSIADSILHTLIVSLVSFFSFSLADVCLDWLLHGFACAFLGRLVHSVHMVQGCHFVTRCRLQSDALEKCPDLFHYGSGTRARLKSKRNCKKRNTKKNLSKTTQHNMNLHNVYTVGGLVYYITTRIAIACYLMSRSHNVTTVIQSTILDK